MIATVTQAQEQRCKALPPKTKLGFALLRPNFQVFSLTPDISQGFAHEEENESV